MVGLPAYPGSEILYPTPLAATYLLARTWLRHVCVQEAVFFCTAGGKNKSRVKNNTSQMVIYSLPDFQAAFSTKLRAEKERKLLKPDLNTHLFHQVHGLRF